MAKVDSFSFGSIKVDGKEYRRDLFLLPDGKVRQRKSGFWIFGSHSIKKEEVEELSKAGAEVMVVGIGTNSMAKVSKDAENYIEKAKVELLVLPSREAVTKYNELVERKKKVGALIHITC